MKNKKKLISFIFIAAFFLIYIIGKYTISAELHVGDFKTHLNSKVDSSDFYKSIYSQKDTVIFLNIWATWCGPCLKEIPLLNEIKSRYDNNKVMFISMSYDDDSIKLKNFYANTKFDFRDISLKNYNYRKEIINLLLDTSKSFVDGIALPQTFVIKDKKILYEFSGELDSTTMYRNLNTILKRG